MFREEPEPKNVVAIRREPEEGLLCGSMGVVSGDPMTRGCKDLRLSTCEIKKAGIGGPLVNFADGSFVGMNFYDGRTARTPFLPRRYILKVLQKLELPPSGSDRDQGVQRLDSSDDGTNYDDRWHVPKARYVYFEVDMARFCIQVKRNAMSSSSRHCGFSWSAPSAQLAVIHLDKPRYLEHLKQTPSNVRYIRCSGGRHPTVPLKPGAIDVRLFGIVIAMLRSLVVLDLRLLEELLTLEVEHAGPL
ncbi:uncharacterized protein [Triticum aestivum]|uniref:uncharacterized protein n=1 Tax=Triticum aestivum TaxID=4565 RepID=UPI001D02C33F|nr:uncharacterized protein LOC123056590 [Triticum aestivum]